MSNQNEKKPVKKQKLNNEEMKKASGGRTLPPKNGPKMNETSGDPTDPATFGY